MKSTVLRVGTRSGVGAALGVALWLEGAAFAAVVLIGTQYQQDKPYSEYDCIWNDRNYPTSCPPRALGCNVNVFFKNTGPGAISVSDVTLAGYSLKTVLKRDPGVHNANSIYFYWDNPPQAILDAGEPVWFKAEPASIPAGGVGRVVVRLRSVPVTRPVNVGVVTSGGTLNANVPVEANAPALVSVGFSQDRRQVFLHWRREGGAAPVTVKMDDADVTALTTTVGDPTMNFAVSVINLSTGLVSMSYHVFQGVYADGKTATGGLRAWSRPFIHASWGVFPCPEGDLNCGRAWVDNALNHGFNAVQNQMDSGGVADYLGSATGRAYAISKGYRMIVWNKDQPAEFVLMTFTNDEPDAEEANMERTFCGTGLKLPCGKSPMGILVMRELEVAQDYRNTYPNAPVTVNINGTFRPENYYAWGQAMDVLQVDPYYQRRLQDVYWRDQQRIPLYLKATYIYAVSKAVTTAAEPNPSHVILYSCEWRCQSESACDPEYYYQVWPFPTPESKRIEAYYALAAGAKGLSYWWFKPGYPSNGLGDQSKPAARTLWREMGLYGNEFKTLSDLIVISHPVDVPLEPASNVWARALAVSTNTLLLLVVNDDYYNDYAGCHYNPVSNAFVRLTLPAWLNQGVSAFEVTARGLNGVGVQPAGNRLQINLGTLQLTRLIVLTTDPALRAALQQRYEQEVRPGVCAFAADQCASLPPTLSRGPVSQTIGAGDTASFSVFADGSFPLAYRWQKNGVNLADGGHYSGTDTPTLTIRNADGADAGAYRCVVTNAVGSVTSAAATLTITNADLPPAIVQSPVNQTVPLGGTALFSVLASGAPPLGYQWQKDAAPLADGGRISGAATASLTIQNAQFDDAGAYRCIVTNAYGAATSAVAALTVVLPNPCPAISNANFESGFSLAGGGYIANGWTEWEADPGAVIGYDETALVRSGAHSQRIRVSGGTNGSSGGVFQRVSVTPGLAYAVSFWMLAGDPLTACSLGVDPTGGTNALASAVEWSPPSTDTNWTLHTWTGVAAVNHLTIFLKVATSDNTRRNGYFDDGPSPATLRLEAHRNGDFITLRWPECPPARLEWTPALTPPVIWSAVTNPVALTDGLKQVALPLSSSAGFFRLVGE